MQDFFTTMQGIIVSSLNIFLGIALVDVNKYLQAASFVVGLAVGIMTIVKIWKDLNPKK